VHQQPIRGFIFVTLLQFHSRLFPPNLEVRSGDSSWVKMNVLTDGYSIYKGGLNALQTASFGYYKSPFKGSPATWSENLSGHLGADDAIFGVKCDDE